MKNFELKFKILETSVNNQVINIEYIPDSHFNVLNIKDILPEFKKSLYENVIFKKISELTINKMLDNDRKLEFNIEQELKRVKYLDFKGEFDILQIKKPNMMVYFYENGVELFNYEINLPKKKFSFKVFNSNEFISEINNFVNKIERRIIDNQIKTESEHYHFYNTIGVTQSFDKTLSRINRLTLDKRNYFINKTLKNKLTLKDKNDFYFLTDKGTVDKEELTE